MWRKYSRRAASATISETASSASRVQTFASRSTRSYHSSKTQTAEGWPREAAILTTVGLGLSALAAGSYALSTVHAAPEKKPTSLDNWPTYTEPKESYTGSIAAGTIVGGAALAFFGYAVSRYRRCPSNQILVIQGKVLGAGGRSARCMHGGGAFVWPIFQEYAYISLEPLQIEANLKKALSLENIRVNVPSVFTVAISTNEKIMENAAKRLLGLSPPDIKIQAQDIIFGQLRQVIASMRIDDINKSRDQFVAAVSNNIEAELNKIGLMLINVNITDITDESGYLESIGRKAAQEAVQKAEIDVSEQEKLGAIGVAENKKEAALRIAEMAREQRIGEAKADSEAIFGENEAKVTIAESNARLQIRSAEAYKEAESRKREAEAFVKEAQYRAEAKTALAEAERIEAEKRAELVSPANAKKAETLVQASATAEQMKIAAAAEAEAMYARMEAKARGEFQIMEKKALGMRLMVESAGGSKEAFQMLMLEHVDHLADSSAKAISNLKFDKIVVWDSGNANGGNSATSNFIKGIASALPPTMHMMRDIAGVDLPTYFGSLRPEEGGSTTGEGKTAIPPVTK